MQNADGAKVRVRNEYDSRGRRVKKTVYSNYSNGLYRATNTVTFLYEGWNCMREMGTGYTNANTWGLDVSGTRQGAGGVGGLVFENIRQGTSNTTHTVAYDGNGNVMGLAYTLNSTWSAQYEYGPFGETLKADGIAATNNPFRFSSKYTDPETRLVYYGRRFLNPSTGRWLSRDPAQEKGGKNLYGFVLNDPVGHYDALGLIEVKPFIDAVMQDVDSAANSVRSGYQTLKLYTMGVWDNAVFFDEWMLNGGKDVRVYQDGDRLLELFKRSHGIESARLVYKSRHCPQEFSEEYRTLQGYKDVFFDYGFLNASEWQIGGFRYTITKTSESEVQFEVVNYASWKSFLGEPTLRNWTDEFLSQPWLNPEEFQVPVVGGIDLPNVGNWLEGQVLWDPWPVHTRNDVRFGGAIKQEFRWKEKSPCCSDP